MSSFELRMRQGIEVEKWIGEAVAGQDLYDFELFWYVALQAFERNTYKNLCDFMDDDKFTTREGQYPALEFDWEGDSPETMKRICPNLFEKFC